MSAQPEQSPPAKPAKVAKAQAMHVQALSKEVLDAWIGRVVDNRYRVVRLLGAGGMGAVFIAEQLKLKKDVAFKIIRKEYADENVFASRFEREAMTTAQLENPHIVSAIDYGLLPEGGAYLVLQLAPGQSLANIMDSHGALPWPQVCSLGAQLADAMVAAHAIGIVHRDLKPDNILVEVRSSGRLHARVLDFGLARIIQGDQLENKGISIEALTRQGALVGTPGYMAPEQITGGSVDARADLYALGVILWECITGTPLWRADSYTELFSKQLGQAVPTLQGEQANQVPDALVKLVAQLVAQKPEDRPHSAEPVRKLLEELALSGGAGAQMSGTTGVKPLTAMAENTPRAPQQGTLALAAEQIRSDPATRKILTYLLIATLLVVPLSLGIALQCGGGGGGEPVPAAIAEDVKTLSSGTSSSAREKAAATILAHEPADEVPSFARYGASIMIAGDCEALNESVERLIKLGDPRGIPVLKRLMAESRKCTKDKKSAQCSECLSDAHKALIKGMEAPSDG
ncbi:MAG: serine/threonine protein kinase [Myxococcales bacterium]|nr:serine/threonine protein kinase [Myxococcales bacterium]